MIRFYDVENTANMAQATLKRSTGVNGSKTITGEIIAGNAVINGIGRGWSLVFEDEPYIITYTKFNDQTNSVEFDAIQKFFWDFAKSGFYQEWNGSHAFTDYLDALFKNTGYEYILEANVAAFEKENWGMKNRLALFNDVISQAGVEFELIGKRVKITKSIGSDLSTIVRKGFNLSDMVKESSITDFVTYGKGFGAFNDSNDQSKGRLEVEYRSPLADIYGTLEADPLVDERYTIADSLLAAVKSKVDNSVAISIDLKIYDLPDADFTYQVPQSGDWIMAIDEAIGFSRRIRIINVDEEFDVNGQRIDYTATCGDLPIAVQQELAQSGQAHKIEQLTNDVDAAAISANGKNSNYYGSAEPSQPREGDLWYKKNGDDTELYVWANGRWEIVVSKNTSNIIDKKVDSKLVQLNADMSAANSNLQVAQQDVANLQTKLKDNDKAQAQLKSDLSENSTILEKAKADIVTNANGLTELDTKLKDNDETQAQLKDDLAANTKVQDRLTTDLAANSTLITQNKQAIDDAMGKVNENLTQAQFDAAQAVKHVDQAVASAKSSADASGLSATSAQAASDAANAAKQLATEVSNNFPTVKEQASSAASDASAALKAANGASSTSTKASQDVDSLRGTIKTLATTETVDAIKGEVSKATTDIETIGGQMKQVYTKSETTNLLGGYATQTWAQNQIDVSADGLTAKLSQTQTQLDGISIGGRNLLLGTRDFSSINIQGHKVAVTNGQETFQAATGTQGSGAIYDIATFNSLPLEKDTDYTASFWAKASENTNIWSYLYDSGSNGNYADGSTKNQATTEYTRFVVHFHNGNNKATPNFIPVRIQKPGVTAWVYGCMLERGNKATDWSPAPEDTATYTDTKVAELKVTVDGLSATFAKQTDLATTASNLKLTADGLNLLTTATGKNGEKVTQVIADVKNIKTTMTGANGYTTRLQTLEGFQSTASNDLSSIKSQQTLLANQYTSIIGDLGNMVRGGDFEDQTVGQASPYWPTSGAIVSKNYDTNTTNASATTLQITGLETGNRDILYSDFLKVSSTTYAAKMKTRWDKVSQNGSIIFYIFEYDANKVQLQIRSIINDNAGGTSGHGWQEFTGTYTPGSDVAYIKLDITYNGALETSSVWVDDIDFREDLANNSQINQLQDMIDLGVKVDGKVTAALSLSADGGGTVTIRGASLYVTAASHFDAASIQSAAIASLDATKITSGSISSDRLATTKLNADNITSGSISSDRLATTKLNADNITSGKINADLITTGKLSADRIVGGTFDARKMTVKNINAGSITSGSIATERLSTTKLNADNITSGSIAADRIATTALSATNITSGTLDVGKLTVKNLSADFIASGTIDASNITVKNLSASNIIGGELDAGVVNVKNLDATNIITGTLNAGLVNVSGLNAASITTGTITGANLAINLNSGQVVFQSGRIHSTTDNIDINIDKGYMSVADNKNRVILKGGQLQFIQPQLFDLQTTPYLSISNNGTGSNWAGATIVGRDSIMLANSANVGDIYTWEVGKNTFSGLISGKNSDGSWDPTIVGGADRGVVIVGGSSTSIASAGSPYIRVGSSLDGSRQGNRIYMRAEYFHVPTVYQHTASGSANVIVNSDGALVRTSSATKYKSNIERFRNTDMGEVLLTLPQAHWYNKGDMQRYADDQQHYSMPELDYGMIAEDLAAAGLEDLVVRGSDGELEDIRYDRIGPALLPLLAKMKQEIEELKGEKSE